MQETRFAHKTYVRINFLTYNAHNWKHYYKQMLGIFMQNKTIYCIYGHVYVYSYVTSAWIKKAKD